MTPKSEETIFAEALRLPPEERAAYLAESTHGQPELRRRVESLLGSFPAGDFLEEAAVSQLRPPLPVTVALTEKPGDTIGRYKLLQPIGEGGCGVVYMAEQEEPVSRRVALKIIKLGMDTKSVIARFEAERQALALMDHPNIARVFDAGATEAGRPYFVMELVRGLKITAYCDESKLSTADRLDLFIQVCHALQHAHQKGIIHRDIKPSNILVTVNDGVAVPKVIDFGIAKATTGQKLTDKTLFTAFEQFIGTPAYMSPEQAVLTSLDIDTRSDIYALGVLLYELLTGRTPFDAQELLSAGLDEMRRTILEEEPARPSTRLSTLSGQELSTTAQRRSIEAPHLVSELRGDLDWIVMKALEKDRARRYETANGLAMDIRRHLDNEPVVACPPTRVYRLRKMVRRNQLAFTAVSGVVASLLLGLSLATVSFFRERTARAHADEQAAIAKSVNDFVLEDLLRQADSRFQAEAQFIPDPNLTLREALDRAAERIGRFKSQPLEEAAVRMTLGKALTGVGEADRGVPHLERALELRRGRLPEAHPDTLNTMQSLAWAYQLTGKLPEALPLIEKTLELQRIKWGSNHSDTLRSMNILANVYQELGRVDQALPLRTEMLTLTTAKLGPDDPLTLMAMSNLAASYGVAGKPEEASSLQEEALKVAKTKLPPGHPFIPFVMANLADGYSTTLPLDRKLSLCEDAMKLVQTSRGPNHPDTFYVMRVLGSMYGEAGELHKALNLLQETLRLTEAKLGPNHLHTLQTMRALGAVHSQAGRFDRALPLLEQVLNRMKSKMANHPNTVVSMRVLSDAYFRAGKFDEALALIDEIVTIERSRLGPEHPDTRRAMWNLALAYLRAGKPDQAVSVREEILKIAEAKYGVGHLETLGPMGELGCAYRDAGKFDQAIHLLEKTVKLHQERRAPDDPGTLRWMNELGVVYWRAGRIDQARSNFQHALPLTRTKLGPAHPNTLMGLHNLAWLNIESGQRDEGLRLLEEKLELIKTTDGPDGHDTLRQMADLAQAYDNAGKWDQALRLQEKVLELRKTKFGPQSRETLLSMGELAVFYDHDGKIDRAESLLERTVQLMKASLGTNDSETLHAMRNLAVVYQENGKRDRAAPLCEETFKLSEAKWGPDHPDTHRSLGDLLNLHLAAKNYTEADNWGLRLATALSQCKDPAPVTTSRTLAALVQSLVGRRQWVRAEQMARDYLAICEKTQPDGWITFNARSLFGGVLLEQRKVDEAARLVMAGYEGLKQQAETTANLDNSAKDELNAAMDRLEMLYDLYPDHPDSGRWKGEIERVRRPNDPGAIRDWLILAPIPLAPDQSPVSALSQEQLEGEANLHPRSEDKAYIGSHQFVWRQFNFKDYVVNFNRLLGDEETPRSVAYAVCYVHVGTPQKSLVVKVGSDDQARVYINGEKIYENLQARALALDEDTILNVELHAGLNVVVFKVVNGESAWGGSLRFADQNNQPVPGLRVTLSPK